MAKPDSLQILNRMKEARAVLLEAGRYAGPDKVIITTENVEAILRTEVAVLAAGGVPDPAFLGWPIGGTPTPREESVTDEDHPRRKATPQAKAGRVRPVIKCRECGKDKPENKFPTKHVGGRDDRCRACRDEDIAARKAVSACGDAGRS